MKQRKGFVSNSSSSSFVIIGYEVDMKRGSTELEDLAQHLAPEKMTKLKELATNKSGEFDVDSFEDEMYEAICSGELFKGVDFIRDDSVAYLGKEICQAEDWGLEYTENTIRELMIQGEEIQGVLKRTDSASIFTGTRAT